jgi:hypothetical protein
MLSGLRGAGGGDEGQEQVVHDGEDPLRRHRLVGHQHVVAHQVDRHGQDGRGDAVEVDLAAFVRPGEDLGRLRRPVGQGLLARLGRGEAGARREPKNNQDSAAGRPADPVGAGAWRQWADAS